jgi:hypothetical protein
VKGLAGALAALGLLAAGPAAAEPFSPAPWVADLDQLRDAMSLRYPNLDWAVERGMDLPATYARARSRLEAARDDYQARSALERFVKAFADGHFEIRWPAPPPPAAAAPRAEAQPPLCERLGWFEFGDNAIAPRLPGFRRLGAEGSPFTAGVVEVAGRQVGVLRVPLFEPQGFPALCDRLLAEAKLTPQSPCDETCQQKLSLKADVMFGEELRRQLAAVAAARPDVLLVDLADNGGGNDSALLLAKLVTDKPLRRPRAAFIRVPEITEELQARWTDVHAAAAAAKGPERAALQRFDAALARARTEATVACDRSGLWRGEAVACSALVDEPAYDGPLPVTAPGAPLPDWLEIAAPYARFGPAEPIWRGPLIVLVDWNSASATELFAAMLQDAHAALIVGAPTFGAGCGHVSGAGPVTLKNSGAVVSMPDCMRFRADGTDEVAGVQPDLAIGFRIYETPKQRLELLQRKLPEAVDRALAGGDRRSP